MEQYKQEFIEFMIDCNVLKFGDFVTKSATSLISALVGRGEEVILSSI